MTRMSENARNELIKIMQDERSEIRCALVQEFKKERDEVANDYDVEIEIDNQHIKKLETQIRSLMDHKRKLNEKRTELLIVANLNDFNYGGYSCGSTGRPQALIDFDIETRNLKKEILER